MLQPSRVRISYPLLCFGFRRKVATGKLVQEFESPTLCIFIYKLNMKKIIHKIENFLVAMALLIQIVIPGRELLKPPKKKNYIGRIVLSLLGLVVSSLALLFLIVIIVSVIDRLFK